ncbi:hypothetical protein ACP70R_035040 [Stipagrostis hirtigluma subsp. patula]
MASTQTVVIGLIMFLLLASSPSMVQARMVPRNNAQAQVHAEESNPSLDGSIIDAPASPSHVLPAEVAPPTPPSPPAGKPEMAAAKRWGTGQVTDGSVPSPGAGH